MRVTNSMMLSTLLRNLNTNMEKMSKSQEQMSSGSRINRPSDDPVGIVDSLRLRTNLTELKQFKSNAEDAQSWLDITDGAMDASGKLLDRVRYLTIQAATDLNPQLALDAIATEISQLKEQLVQVANTKYGDRYVFSGTMTQTASFDPNNLALGYQGNNGQINYEVGAGTQIPINVDGTQAFGNVFNVLQTIWDDVNAGNTLNLSGTDLGLLNTEIDNQLKVRADIGARVNRLDLAINRMDSQDVNLTGLLSKTEDVDVAELITKLKVQESVYNSSLAAGARIVQPTLMDFLR